MAQVPLTYRYRLQPTPEQESTLYRFAGARRFVWNWALEQAAGALPRHQTAA